MKIKKEILYKGIGITAVIALILGAVLITITMFGNEDQEIQGFTKEEPIKEQPIQQEPIEEGTQQKTHSSNVTGILFEEEMAGLVTTMVIIIIGFSVLVQVINVAGLILRGD